MTPQGPHCDELYSGEAWSSAEKWENTQLIAIFLVFIRVTFEGKDSSKHPKASHSAAWLRSDTEAEKDAPKGRRKDRKGSNRARVSEANLPTNKCSGSWGKLSLRRALESFLWHVIKHYMPLKAPRF